MGNRNKITNWSYDKPTEPGVYLCCFGDVEVWSNISIVQLRMNDSEACEVHTGGDSLVDPFGDAIGTYSNGCKWARLLVGSEAKSDAGNE